MTKTAPGETPVWEYLGILSLFDPPRHDTKATIAAAVENGIEVKMVTGDQTAIAKETCRELGMGTNILNTEVLNDASVPADVVAKIRDRQTLAGEESARIAARLAALA